MRGVPPCLAWGLLACFQATIPLWGQQIQKTGSVQLPSSTVGIFTYSFLVVNWRTRTAYVSYSNGSGNGIQVVSIDNLAVTKTIPLALAPSGMCISTSAGMIATTYAPLSGTGYFTGSVILIDPVSGPRSPVDSGTAFGAQGCSFSQDGGTLYVSSNLSGGQSTYPKLAAIDVVSGQVKETWATGANSVPVVQVVPNGLYLLTENLGAGTGDVSDFNGTAFNPLGLGFMPQAIGLAPNGRAYISGLSSNLPKAVVFDTATNTKVADMGTLAPSFYSWPSQDGWFGYAAWSTGFAGINFATQTQALQPTSDQSNLTNYGIASNRETDGSDTVVLVRPGSLDVFKATQPASPYAVTNGASFGTGPNGVGQLSTVFGRFPGVPTCSAPALPLTTTLCGVSVQMFGTYASLLYVSDSQINFQFPSNLPVGGNSKIFLNIQYTGNTSTGIQVIPAAASPAAFMCSATDACVFDGPSLVTTGSPAHPGDVLTIYATGLGATSPSVPDGYPAPSTEPLARATVTPTVTIGGVNAQVQFAGRCPTFVGLDQINVVVPQGITAGSVPLVIASGTASGTVNIAVAK